MLSHTNASALISRANHAHSLTSARRFDKPARFYNSTYCISINIYIIEKHDNKGRVFLNLILVIKLCVPLSQGVLVLGMTIKKAVNQKLTAFKMVFKPIGGK